MDITYDEEDDDDDKIILSGKSFFSDESDIPIKNTQRLSLFSD
jgi:hypothetical protein